MIHKELLIFIAILCAVVVESQDDQATTSFYAWIWLLFFIPFLIVVLIVLANACCRTVGRPENINNETDDVVDEINQDVIDDADVNEPRLK